MWKFGTCLIDSSTGFLEQCVIQEINCACVTVEKFFWKQGVVYNTLQSATVGVLIFWPWMHLHDKVSGNSEQYVIHN